MSRSPFFFVEKFNFDTGKYELQHPIVKSYNYKGELKEHIADLFPYNGCHDLFSIVEETGDLPRMRGIHKGLPDGVCEEIKKSYDDCCFEIEGCDDKKHLYTPKVRWFTYADMYIYCLEHPETVDYEAMDEAYYDKEGKPEKIMKPTPMKSLKDRVDAFLEVIDSYGLWEDYFSSIRIVCWIEC